MERALGVSLQDVFQFVHVFVGSRVRCRETNDQSSRVCKLAGDSRREPNKPWKRLHLFWVFKVEPSNGEAVKQGRDLANQCQHLQRPLAKQDLFPVDGASPHVKRGSEQCNLRVP